MTKKAVVIGYSGHAYVLIDVLREVGYTVAGYFEREEKSFNPYNLPYLGQEEDPQSLAGFLGKAAFVGIGNNLIRSKVFGTLNANNILTPSVVHPSSVISESVTLGIATLVMPGAIVNSLSKIGKGVICNTSSVVEHECIIADFVHIAPGAVLAGNVSVGENSFIGANAVVKEGVKIGANAIIGAGSVILKDVADGVIIAGNPAKRIL